MLQTRHRRQQKNELNSTKTHVCKINRGILDTKDGADAHRKQKN